MIADNDIENDIQLYVEAAYITNAAIDVLDGTTAGVNNANGSWEFVACQSGNIANTILQADIQFGTYGGSIVAIYTTKLYNSLPVADYAVNRNGGPVDYLEYGCQAFVVDNELATALADYTTTADLAGIITTIVESYDYTTSSSVTTIVNNIVNNIPVNCSLLNFVFIMLFLYCLILFLIRQLIKT